MNRSLLDNALRLGMLAVSVFAVPRVTYAQSCELPKEVSRLDESRRIFYVEADLSQIDTPTKAIKFLTPLEEFTTKCRDWRREWEAMFFRDVHRAYSKDEMEQRHLPVPDKPDGWYRRGMQVLWVDPYNPRAKKWFRVELGLDAPKGLREQAEVVESVLDAEIHDPASAPTACLTVEGQDPSQELLRRINTMRASPHTQIHAGSACPKSGPTTLINIGPISWYAWNRAKVSTEKTTTSDPRPITTTRAYTLGLDAWFDWWRVQPDD